MRPTKAYIDLSRLDKNIRELKRLIGPDVGYMAVVKANAYGHGAVEVSKQAIESGANYLAVAIPEEGAELREAGIKAPILVLGSITDDEAELVAKYNLIQTVYSKDIVCMLNALGKEHNRIVPVHIKLDTGMGRIGIRNDRELIDLLEQIKKLSYIDCQGVFTHFSTSDESDKTYTKEQLKIFNEMLHICKSYDIHFKYVHAANSAAIIDCPNTYFNMVRGGIAMYGYYPSDEVELQKVDISPVLEWHTKVMHIKEVKRGDAISYGKTFIAQKPMKIATIPVGYGDGYNRLLSNRGYVLVRGKRVPIVGRICMDQTMIDVTPIEDVSVGDDVVLIGKQGENLVSANDIARLCSTISYEILTGISTRVERIYIK